MELKRLLGYNKVNNNLENIYIYILVLKMHQNSPLGMQNSKITWGRPPDPPSRRGKHTPTPFPPYTDCWHAALMLWLLKIFLLLLFYKLKTLKLSDFIQLVHVR